MLEALRTRAATVRLILASLALVAGMFLFVFPTRTWWSARQQVRSAGSSLSLLQRENARLDGEVRRLHDDAEIEKLARSKFGYVFPGEHPYTAIPAPPTTTTTTTMLPPPEPSTTPTSRR
jgi:cell division protein FtsB